MYHEDGYQVTHHTCPRNCYDSCPMLAYTRGGRIEKLVGDGSTDPAFFQLCSKASSILGTVEHPQRLLFPLRQAGRGTGRWQRISWDTAIDISVIAGPNRQSLVVNEMPDQVGHDEREPWERLQIGDAVIHKSLGPGEVMALDDKYLIVKFSDRESKFLYPAAFEKGYLTV